MQENLDDQLGDITQPVPEPEAPVSEPTKKRAYKPRAPKVKEETLSTNETPTRKPRAKKASVENTAKQLMGIHKMLALLPNMGFMEIQQEEATMLAQAMLDVAAEYDVQISGKTGATIQLMAAAGMIYVPRAIYAAGEVKKRKAALPANLPEVEKTPPAEPLHVAANGSPDPFANVN